jgi:hypothetical protein
MEIKDSEIFDHLKMELGFKPIRKMLKRKVRLIPMDVTKEGLGLSS